MHRFLIAVLLAAAPLAAQEHPKKPAHNTVFSVSTTLVQVDAVVTDHKGRQVTTLTPQDFSVQLDGKPQKITNFSYINLSSPDVNQRAVTLSSGRGNLVRVIRPQDVHRSMVLLVNDLGLSFTSMVHVRQVLRHFIEDQMRPGDLVALWETGHTNSVFQQFTSNKRLLEAAVDSLRWNPNGTGMLDAVSPNSSPEDGRPMPGSRMPHMAGERQAGQQNEDNGLQASLAFGTLNVLNHLLDELTRVGGRKAIVLFSDGIEIQPDITDSMPHPAIRPIRDQFSDGAKVLRDITKNMLKNTLQTRTGSAFETELVEMMQRIIDKADRAGVVIYAIDPRGLLYLRSPATLALMQSQVGLRALAEPTGGTATVNSNGLSDAMERIENDLQGYYLIGFKAPPGISTGNQDKIDFHSLKVRVKVHGLHVYSRAGFLGETDAAARPKLTTPIEQMRAAMFSLFNQSAIHVRLTALYTRATDGRAAVRNLIYVDPRDLTFKPEKSGKRKALLDVVVIATGAQGGPLATLSRKLEIDAGPEQLKRLDRRGIVFSFDIPVKHPGPYQVRVSVRDAASAAIGSAGQYIEIPNVEKQHLVMTTPILDKASIPPNKRFKDSASVLREFHAGSSIALVSLVETAKRRLGAPEDLEGEIRLYRGDTEILRKSVPVVPVTGQQIHAIACQVRLGSSLPAGQYYLEAIAREPHGDQVRTASTWTNFEVLPQAE